MKKLTIVLALVLLFIFLFNLMAYAGEEGKAIKQIKFLMKKGLHDNALVRADFYLNAHPESLRVRKLKIDILVELRQFDEALKNYEIFIKYSKAKKENISILSDILVPYLKSLKDRNLLDDEKKRLIAILCEIKDKETIRDLKTLYAFPHEREDKIQAASLLAQLGKTGYIPYLKKAAKLPDLLKDEKLYIIFAFSTRKNESLKNVLLSMLRNEKDPEIIAYIYWALTRMGESHRRELRNMLNKVSDNNAKSTILFLLGELKDTKFTIDPHSLPEDVLTSYYWAEYRRGHKSMAINELRHYISSSDKRVSIHAIFYIGLIGDKPSIPILRHKIVETDDIGIKISAISAIIRIIRKERINTEVNIKLGFSITL